MVLRFLAAIMDAVTVIGALIGGYQVWTSMTAPEANAVQLASGVCLGAAIAVVPYCLAGAFHRAAVREELRGPRD